MDPMGNVVVYGIGFPRSEMIPVEVPWRLGARRSPLAARQGCLVDWACSSASKAPKLHRRGDFQAP